MPFGGLRSEVAQLTRGTRFEKFRGGLAALGESLQAANPVAVIAGDLYVGSALYGGGLLLKILGLSNQQQYKF